MFFSAACIDVRRAVCSLIMAWTTAREMVTRMCCCRRVANRGRQGMAKVGRTLVGQRRCRTRSSQYLSMGSRRWVTGR